MGKVVSANREGKLVWYDGDWQWAPGPEVESGERPCDHWWERYVGFTQTYDYCTLCDAKRVP